MGELRFQLQMNGREASKDTYLVPQETQLPQWKLYKCVQRIKGDLTTHQATIGTFCSIYWLSCHWITLLSSPAYLHFNMNNSALLNQLLIQMLFMLLSKLPYSSQLKKALTWFLEPVISAINPPPKRDFSSTSTSVWATNSNEICLSTCYFMEVQNACAACNALTLWISFPFTLITSLNGTMGQLFFHALVPSHDNNSRLSISFLRLKDPSTYHQNDRKSRVHSYHNTAVEICLLSDLYTGKYCQLLEDRRHVAETMVPWISHARFIFHAKCSDMLFP